jgi:hypothetical protein
MKPNMRSMFVTALAITLAAVLSFAGDTEDQALEAAEQWLDLVDRGEYEKSWMSAAALLRAAVTLEQWEHALNAARKPLGEVKSRKLRGAEYTTSMPGAPDGEYVVIQFDTSFANKKEAVETITPMKDAVGVWRVSGYYVK